MSNTRVVDGPGFRIRFDDEAGYLRAHVSDGTDSLEVSLAMWRMLADECEAIGCTRLLVVEELDDTVTPAELALVIEAVAKMGFLNLRVAFVELRDDIQIAELGEILSIEQGLTARAFSHENDGRRWLLYGD